MSRYHRVSHVLPILIWICSLACAISTNAAEVAVADLQLELPADWTVAESPPLGADLLCLTADGSTLVLARHIEPDGLAADPAAWINGQILRLSADLPNAKLGQRSVIRLAETDWQQCDYTFVHTDQTYHQRCWMMVRVASGAHQAWIMTWSTTEPDRLDAPELSAVLASLRFAD